MNELWIPILGVICAVGMPVLLGIIASYMTIKSKHEEKMAMIEKGIVLEEAMFFLLVPAITIMFGGVAFIIYFFLSRSLMEKERLEDEKKMRLEE